MLFTSYHARAIELLKHEIQPISISVVWPSYSTVRYPELKELAPTLQMLKMTQEDYDRHFQRILSNLDPDKIHKWLLSQKKRHGVALLCYEKNRMECHRNTVAEWFQINLNLTFVEWEKPKKPNPQVSLF